MNNKEQEKCCEKCCEVIKSEPFDYEVQCTDKNCPCHTPPPVAIEEKPTREEVIKTNQRLQKAQDEYLKPTPPSSNAQENKKIYEVTKSVFKKYDKTFTDLAKHDSAQENTPDTEELDEDHDKAEEDAMKVLNAPDTEEWNYLQNILFDYGNACVDSVTSGDRSKEGLELEKIKNYFSSRDTYWKERVKMIVGGINFRRQIKGAFENYAHAHPEVPQFNSDVRRCIEKRLHANIRTLVLSKLTNEDNLK